MNAKTNAAVSRHGENIKALFGIEGDPVNVCRKLRRIERRGEAFALRCCNGPEWPSEDAQEAEAAAILAAARAVLGDRVPVILNRDPRGYALKIPEGWMREHAEARIHRDGGGYGIIAPDLTER